MPQERHVYMVSISTMVSTHSNAPKMRGPAFACRNSGATAVHKAVVWTVLPCRQMSPRVEGPQGSRVRSGV